MIEWHAQEWRQLLGDSPGGLSRLPHALLLCGDPGMGKSVFANDLVRLLLCEQPGAATAGPAACGRCEACRWADAGNHPDYRLVTPETDDDESAEGDQAGRKKGSSQIKVDAVRALEEFVFVGSHRQGRRVVLIDPAESMNATAANALLKILEEPPSSVYFILVSSFPRRLLPTIRSRTRVLPFRRPSIDQGLAWLKQAGMGKGAERYLALAGGAPFLAIRWKEEGQLDAIDALLDTLAARLEDPVALAGRWDGLLKKHPKCSLDFLVETVQRSLIDRSLVANRLDSHYGTGGALSAAGDSARGLSTAWREVLRCRRSARHPLNQTLFLENLAVLVLRSQQQRAPAAA